MPNDKDVMRLQLLTKEDIEVEERLKVIMNNSELLKGKEYMDFVIDYLLAKGEQAIEKKGVCMREITVEIVDKLKGILSEKDLLYYFNAKGGMKVLVESMEFS